MESAVKQFNQRVKGTEKFWSEPGAEAMLQLQADHLSDHAPLERFWQTRQKTQTGQRPLPNGRVVRERTVKGKQWPRCEMPSSTSSAMSSHPASPPPSAPWEIVSPRLSNFSEYLRLNNQTALMASSILGANKKNRFFLLTRQNRCEMLNIRAIVFC